MLDRKQILSEAIDKCFEEMYAKSQPSADFKKIVEEVKNGTRDKDERVFEQHYLSREEYNHIVDKYKDAYNIRSHWKDDVEVVEEYLSKGGHKDKYIPEKKDENGFVHPGYRSFDDVPPIKDLIKKCLDDRLVSKKNEELAEDIAKIVLDTVSECKNYYKFDREENSFDFTCVLGASPTPNPETVKKYWKEKTGEDIEIEERNPLLIWEKDYYGEEFEEIMEDEYGENWKEYWDNEWQKEKDKKEAEHKRLMEELSNKTVEDE